LQQTLASVGCCSVDSAALADRLAYVR